MKSSRRCLRDAVNVVVQAIGRSRLWRKVVVGRSPVAETAQTVTDLVCYYRLRDPRSWN